MKAKLHLKYSEKYLERIQNDAREQGVMEDEVIERQMRKIKKQLDKRMFNRHKSDVILKAV